MLMTFVAVIKLGGIMNPRKEEEVIKEGLGSLGIRAGNNQMRYTLVHCKLMGWKKIIPKTEAGRILKRATAIIILL